MQGSEVHALKPYPSYRESGVPWLGKVPAHWEVRRIRSIASVLNGATPSSNNSDYWDGNIAWITPQDLGVNGKRYIDTSGRQITQAGYESCAATLAAAGTLVISIRAPIGHIAILGCPACVNQGCRLIVPTSALFQSEYLHYSLLVAKEELKSFGQGTTFSELSADALASFQVPFLPDCEQSTIVCFLDHADRRIRRYIRVKEKLTALLEEQKQVVIHQAVTGQIDVRTGQPYPAYKPSGVEWLKAVPAHWEFRAAKWYYREVDDRSETGMEELLSVSHITGVTPRSEKNVTMFKAESNIGYKLCKSDDIVVNTMWAWMAALGIAKQDGIVSPSYAVYRSRRSSNLRGDYADLLLRTTAYRNEYRRRSTGIRSSRLRLYPDEFLRIKFLCPPPEEQQHIVTFVANESKAQRRSIESSRQEIDLLREYRTRLIADVVTGKLDVREAAAALPEEPGDPDALEADCAEAEGGDDGRPDRDRRTAVPATQEEMTS